MILGIVLALIASFSYGLGSVLQAKSNTPDNSAVNSAFSALFIGGTILDGFGFLANMVATKQAALFLVQPIIATNLLFAAILSVFILKTKLNRASWIAIIVVVIGLGALGIGAGNEGKDVAPTWLAPGLLITSIILILICVPLSLLLKEKFSIPSGVISGVLFAVVAISIRLIYNLHSLSIITLIIAGIGAFALLSIGVRFGKVAVVLAAMIVGETLIPAVVGVYWLGDTIKTGTLPIVVLGFILAIAGAITLAFTTETH